MRKISAILLSTLFAVFLSSEAISGEKKYPNIEGQIFSQMQLDRVVSTNKTGVSVNSGFLYVQSDVELNFNKNWSASTQWRLNPNNVYNTRNGVYPERNRTFFGDGRGFKLGEEGLIIEEIRLNYKGDDAEFYVGKFDPKFGETHDPQKKLGIFTSQFNYDYYMREKLGASATALLEDSKIIFSTFFNDTTGLSRSALDDRGRAISSNGSIAGSTGTLSSYSLTMDGDNLFGRKNLKYNVGYRSLGVGNSDSKRESGYIFGSEYVHEIGLNTTVTPLIEIVNIRNFTGEAGRNATYATFAVTMQYSSWNFGVSSLNRNIKQLQRDKKVSDRQMQIFTGYKFTNNLSLDVTQSRIKEDGSSGNLFGVSLSYLYKF